MLVVNITSRNGQPVPGVTIIGRHPENFFIGTSNSHGRIEWPININGECNFTLMHKRETHDRTLCIDSSAITIDI